MTHTHSATPSHGRLYGLMSALACFLLLAAVQVSAKDISVKDAATLLQNPPQGLTIVDVRTPAEFREGHLAGAINMDFFGASFDSQILGLPKGNLGVCLRIPRVAYVPLLRVKNVREQSCLLLVPDGAHIGDVV